MFNIGSAELVVLLFILVVSAAGVWLVVRATRTSRQANRALIEMNEREKRSEQGGRPSA